MCSLGTSYCRHLTYSNRGIRPVEMKSPVNRLNHHFHTTTAALNLQNLSSIVGRNFQAKKVTPKWGTTCTVNLTKTGRANTDNSKLQATDTLRECKLPSHGKPEEDCGVLFPVVAWNLVFQTQFCNSLGLKEIWLSSWSTNCI